MSFAGLIIAVPLIGFALMISDAVRGKPSWVGEIGVKMLGGTLIVVLVVLAIAAIFHGP